MTISTRTLGTTDPLTVSALGLGCMGMSEFYGTPDEHGGIATIHRALDLGVTFLDTADMYGPFTNEQLVGKAIAGRRDEVQLATKFGNERGADGSRLGINGSPEYVRARLRRLAAAARRRPHRPLLPAPRRPDRPDRGDRRRDGRARRGRQGPPPRPVRGLRRHHPRGRTPCTRSPPCRPSTRCSPATSRTRSCRRLRELGIGLVPYSPLGRGLLTGAITRDTGADGEGDSRRSAYFPRFQGDALDANLALVEQDPASSPTSKDCTPGQLALAWVLAQGDDVAPIPGTKRVTYLEENVAAADVDAHRGRPRRPRAGGPARRRRRRPLRRHVHIDA